MQAPESHRRRIDQTTLAGLRAMESEHALALLAVHLKADPTFRRLKDVGSRRWQVSTVRGHFEILTTGTSWYDTRAQKGGGGAIDLAMHLEELSFMDAVRRLQQCIAAAHG